MALTGLPSTPAFSGDGLYQLMEYNSKQLELQTVDQASSEFTEQVKNLEVLFAPPGLKINSFKRLLDEGVS